MREAIRFFVVTMCISSAIWILGVTYIQLMDIDMTSFSTASYISMWFASVLFGISVSLRLEVSHA